MRGKNDDPDKPSVKRKKTEEQDLNDGECKETTLKKIIFIDSTWNQTNKILTDERLQGKEKIFLYCSSLQLYLIKLQTYRHPRRIALTTCISYLVCFISLSSLYVCVYIFRQILVEPFERKMQAV